MIILFQRLIIASEGTDHGDDDENKVDSFKEEIREKDGIKASDGSIKKDMEKGSCRNNSIWEE